MTQQELDLTEIIALDPSSRIELTGLSRDLSNSVLSERIWTSLRDDAFTVRLRQVAWEAYRLRKPTTTKSSSSGTSSSSNGGSDAHVQIDEFLKECGLKEVPTCNMRNPNEIVYTQLMTNLLS